MFRQVGSLPFRSTLATLRKLSVREAKPALFSQGHLAPLVSLPECHSVVPFRSYAAAGEVEIQKPRLRYEQFYDNSKRDGDRIHKGLFLGTMTFMLLGFWGVTDYLMQTYIPNYRRPARGAKAKSRELEASEDADVEAEGEGEVVKKKRVGFRDRKVIAYEDRIRQYSTPDKIFRYFATLQLVDPEDGSTEILMTPSDFVRSLTPGLKQIEGLGLDSFKKYNPLTDELRLEISPDSVFYALGDKALISFSDYVFLLTVLSTPPRQFEIAFRMFDLNSDGNLDIDEFRRVQSILREQSNVGKRHRDHSTTGSTLKPQLNTALSTFFFGEDGKGELNVSRMLDFQAKLQRELNRIEFDRYEPDEEDRISEIRFAQLLLTYGGFPEAKKRKMIKRVRMEFSEDKNNLRGITFRQYLDFSQLLKSIADVDTALTFYHLASRNNDAGASIDKDTFKHVTLSVAGVELDDHVVDVVFILFDEDGDQHLSNKEFVSVMKHRLLRGLDKPMDTGVVRFLSAFNTCAKERLFSYWHSE